METDRLGSGEQDEVDLNDSGPSGIRMQPVPATAMPAEIRERRRPRRDNYQVSNLNHLHPEDQSPVAERHILSPGTRKIAFCLLTFDLWTLYTFQLAWFSTKPRVNGRGDWEELKQILGLTADLVHEEIYESRYEVRAMEILSQWSDGNVDGLLYDMRTCKYYPKSLRLSMNMWKIAHLKENYAKRTTDLTVPEGIDCLSPEEYIGYLVDESASAKYRLKTMVKGLRTLCTCIRTAAEKGELCSALSSNLKLKVDALHKHFDEAASALGEPSDALISLDSPEWWVPEMEAERARLSRLHEPPTDAVQAYNNAPDISATLSFLVPTVSLLSCIPAALAWYNSPPQNGTPHDANFYQLISSNIMQLLGLFLMIWPTAAHTKLAQFARVWTWVLAGASACFTAMAVPLYLCLPTGWSALLSFGGSIAQVLILLQLRHAA